MNASDVKHILKVPCNWVNCSDECSDVIELNNHIKRHIQQYIKGSSKNHHECPWMDCKFQSDQLKTLERHVYYHGYYESLIAIGKHESDTNPYLPKCSMAKQVHKIPELKTDFNCEWMGCERAFVSIIEFQDHIAQHAIFDYEMGKTPTVKRPKTRCKWNYCDKVLDNKYRLLEHIQTHSQKKNTSCYHCGELFRTKTTLSDHLRRQPDNNTHKYQCTHCLKFFATEKLLRCHVSKHLNCYKCSLCDMTCASTSALTTHIRYRHLKERPIKCSKCDYRGVRNADIEKHMQFAHSNKVFRCEHNGCNYAVRSYNFLRRHYLEFHENTPFIYLCHCCEKPFKSGQTLSNHLIKAHDFQLPSGHKRFTYRVDNHGFYRLETMRIESLEVTKQILSPNPYGTTELTEDSSCFEIVSLSYDPDELNIATSSTADIRYAGEVVVSIPKLRS